MKKQKIAFENGVYRYYDINGIELKEGDMVKYKSGRIEKLYLTESGELGTDATNKKWLESGKAYPCEYGIYPLENSDVEEIEKV